MSLHAPLPPDTARDALRAQAVFAQTLRGRVCSPRELISTRVASKTDAERDAQIIQVNGKLYAIAKVQSDKSCPDVANVPPSSVVRVTLSGLGRLLYPENRNAQPRASRLDRLP
jgi:hypothetical protein